MSILTLLLLLQVGNVPPTISGGALSVLEEGVAQCDATSIDFVGVAATVACIGDAATVTIAALGGSGAPDDAQYWVGAADGTLTNEKNLSGFTGLVLNTVGTPSSKAANTCVAQFPRSDNASGVWTCASIVDADVPNNITIDQATLALTGDSATAFFSAGTLEVARGGTNLTASADDNVMVGNGTTWETKVIPDCDNAVTSKVLYDTTTNTFSCGTDQTAAGAVTTLTSTVNQSDAVIATYTAITGLSFTPAASTNYLIDCYIIYTSTAATTGINFAWDTPATPTAILMTGHTKTVATGANEGFSQNSDNVGTSTSASVITVQHLAYLSTLFRNGSTSATMSLGFTPETANSVSVIAGSVCQYRTY